MAWDKIMRPPPPRPWMKRKKMKVIMVLAVPHRADPSRNRPMAMR